MKAVIVDSRQSTMPEMILLKILWFIWISGHQYELIKNLYTAIWDRQAPAVFTAITNIKILQENMEKCNLKILKEKYDSKDLMCYWYFPG